VKARLKQRHSADKSSSNENLSRAKENNRASTRAEKPARDGVLVARDLGVSQARGLCL
jgi:hypothetical protein